MTFDDLKAHAYTLMMSFLGAVLTAAGLAALQWLGAHIAPTVQLISMLGGSTVAQKLATN